MAKHCYNTFVVQECKSGRVLLVTSSARKAYKLFGKGRRVEVWNCNMRVERITTRCREGNPMEPYIDAEREYIREKQNRKTQRNNRRSEWKTSGSNIYPQAH